MEIKVHRKYKKSAYTIGRMYVDGMFFCNTLEDKCRGLDDSMDVDEILKIKVYGKTAIPTGTYDVKYVMSPKFGRKMPRLQNVKGFDGILIHSLNKPEETEGCIGVGLNTAVGRLTSSRWYSDLLNERIERAIARGQNITIEIYD